jgi:hypothetical protein
MYSSPPDTAPPGLMSWKSGAMNLARRRGVRVDKRVQAGLLDRAQAVGL